MNTKKCSKCGMEKPISGFSKCCRNKDGLQNQCKKCVKQHLKKLSVRKDSEIEYPEIKKCNGCKAIKPSNEFYKDRCKKDGLNNWCIICSKQYEIQRRNKLSARKDSEIEYPETKKCSGCGEVKNIDEYWKRSGRIYGVRSRCKGCESVYGTWDKIKDRCYNQNCKEYQYYGASGIKMCDRWLNSREQFILDMGPKPTPKHSIERVDNDGDYCPENCKWATQSEQMKNQGMRNNNTSGTTGVYWRKNRKAWIASISTGGKKIFIGYFKNKEDAIKARKEAEKKYWE